MTGKNGTTDGLIDSDAPVGESKLERFVSSSRFQKFVLGAIILNATVLGLQTSQQAQDAAGLLLFILDEITLLIFVVELSLKMWVMRGRFFRSGWNVFDFLVVAVALVPYAYADDFELLRALRILRVMRIVSAVPRMRSVVDALLHAIPGMGSVIAIMLLVFYVFGIMTTRLLGEDFPQWFGTLGRSVYSLFQIMTLESWSMGIVRPVMELHIYAWIIFVPFILITAFGVVNLFIALIVSAMSQVTHDEIAHQDEMIEKLTTEVEQLRRDVSLLVERSGGPPPSPSGDDPPPGPSPVPDAKS